MIALSLTMTQPHPTLNLSCILYYYEILIRIEIRKILIFIKKIKQGQF